MQHLLIWRQSREHIPWLGRCYPRVRQLDQGRNRCIRPSRNVLQEPTWTFQHSPRCEGFDGSPARNLRRIEGLWKQSLRPMKRADEKLRVMNELGILYPFSIQYWSKVGYLRKSCTSTLFGHGMKTRNTNPLKVFLKCIVHRGRKGRRDRRIDEASRERLSECVRETA